MLTAVIAAVLVTGGGSTRVEPPPADVVASTTKIERAIIRSASTDYAQLADAMHARMPGVELLPYEASSFAAFEGKPFAYVEIAGDDALTLTVVLHDRRAFVREFVADPDDRVRSIAAVVANTVAGIEQEDPAPTRVDAEIPRPESESESESEPEPESESESEPESESVTAPSRVDIGVALHTGLLVTLSPSVRASAAAGLGVAGAFRNGLVVEGEVRWAGTVSTGFVLSRLRLAALVGYRYRRGNFELVTLAGPSVEPWLVTDSGSLTATRRSGGDRGTAPLLGGLVSAMPGFLLTRPRFTLRIGARLDFAASLLPSGRAAAIKQSAPERTLFTFGGPELTTALAATLWL